MFKLIDFFDFPHFNELRFDMGAPLAKNFKATMEITLIDEESLLRLGKEGIDVKFDEITPQKDRTLGYKGQRVLVYIRDVNKYQDKINMPKFHVSYCKKLEEMRNFGRWERYVVANRQDGYFQVSINNKSQESERLDVCQFCLETLSWSGFSVRGMHGSQRKIAVKEFSISEFFKKFPKSLFSVVPKYTSDTAPINDYTDDWHNVGGNLKIERDFKCDNCQIKLDGARRKYLHVHHKNGLKNDNSKSNLEVLCIRCHANEPCHAHMKGGRDYMDFFTIFDKSSL